MAADDRDGHALGAHAGGLRHKRVGAQHVQLGHAQQAARVVGAGPARQELSGFQQAMARSTSSLVTPSRRRGSYVPALRARGCRRLSTQTGGPCGSAHVTSYQTG